MTGTRVRTSPGFFDTPDGTRLAFRDLGAGRPVLLLHGFLSTGTLNWLVSGHAERLVEAGRRVVVPDLRAHGRSGAPDGAEGYPADVLTDDAVALAAHLELDEYDVAGYSLGALTAARLLARGAPVGRAVLCGQGLSALTDPAGRPRRLAFRSALTRGDDGEFGSPDWLTQQWVAKSRGDRVALVRVLDSAVPTPADLLAGFTPPVLVVMGADDEPDDGRQLAATLPIGSYVEVPGDHLGAAGRDELGVALAAFLA